MPTPQAIDPSTPFSATDHSELAESTSLLGKFASAEVQAASIPTLSGGQTDQTAPASSPEAGDSSTPIYVTEHAALAESSSLLGKFAGADLPTASNPTPSTGQVGQEAVALRPERRDSSTPVSATDHPAPAEFSSLLGKFAGAEVQAASIPTLSGGQSEQAAPNSGPEVSDSSTPINVTDHPALAEFSSLLGKFAGADLQVVADPTPSTDEVGQAPPELGSERRDSSTSVSAPDYPGLAEFSTLLGKLAGGQIDAKFSGNAVQATMVPDKFATKGPVAAGTLSGGLPSVDSVQAPPAPKFENLVNTPAKVIFHSVQVLSTIAAAAAWQTGNMSEAASAPAPLLSAASPLPPPPLEPNSQPVTPGTTLQKDAPLEANSLQPSGAVSADTVGSTAHADLSDSSTSGQGKSGQQSGSAPRDNQAGVKTSAPSPASNLAPDPTANLLTVHAPSVPASHANASAPQTAPPPSQSATALSAWQNYDGGAGKIVRSASLSDSASGAEMHVELRTGALGPLDVHAVVHEGSVGAEIHVQGQEAHTLLAAGLPSLERALGERNLRVENIHVYQDQPGGGMSGGEKQDSQSGSSPSPQRQVLPWDNPPQVSNSASGSSEDEELANPAPGLSVQA
ncbi:MAG TPA: flagellar hook-length control protein FliK [Terriglobia bacterium]|nr:flagellar hook-length control protein FliK [Terriglobia bacterium]